MSSHGSKSLLVIGECMMELTDDGHNYNKAFAGDTYNSAVYAKRRYPQLDVQILTALGTDPISQAMKAQWDQDNIGHKFVLTTQGTHPGIYAISTDARGERSFTYWRKGSAATELMSLLDENTRREMLDFDAIYFSGISLAILSEEDKARLIALIAELKKTRKIIAFDPNYRPILWQDADHAAHWMSQAYQLADIALPGLQDHKDLYNHQSCDDICSFLQGFQIKEIIVKADADGIFGYQLGQSPAHLTVELDPNPMDTTGAGDSFAGTYLAERLQGTPMVDAIRAAAKIANLVVKHRGAIIDAAQYNKAT